MSDVFLLGFGQELRTLGSNHELLHFVFLKAVYFFNVILIHLGESIFHWDVVVGVIACRYILGDLVAELEVSNLKVHLGYIGLRVGALFVLIGDV